MLAQEIELQQVQFNAHDYHTQLILTFNKPVSQRVFSLPDPDRIVIDLPDTKLKAQLNQINLANSVISNIRAAKHDDQRLRIVLDLKRTQTIQTHSVNIRKKGQVQLFVDLTDQNDLQQPAITMSTNNAMRDVIVIIDPGHGGHDPGAIGNNQGLKEKNVVLAIAKTLQQELNQSSGIKAILTRNTDEYIALRERLEIARKYDADLFISIHADAFGNKRAQGASVYTLSSGGASSEAARWLAEKENYSQLGGADLNTLEDSDNNTLRSVLIGLSQVATINQSISLGQGVLNNLGKTTKLHKGQVEQAGFLVLKSPDIPSVLVETGFISNRTEELNLGSRNFRKQLAQAISAGIQSYFANNPPLGSLLEAKEKSDIYQVVAGDSLWLIAKKQGTPIESLKKINKLDSDILIVDQILLIPNKQKDLVK